MMFPILIPILRNSVFLRGYREDVSNYTAIDALAIFDIAALAYCTFWVINHKTQIPWKKLWRGTVKCWIAYYLFALCSIFWRIRGSSAPYIIYRAVSMLVLSTYTYILFSKFKTAQSAFKGLLNTSLGLTILLLLGHLRFGTLHTNTYSACAAITACLAISAYRSKLYTYQEMKPYIYAGIFFLFLGTSSTSNIAFLIGLIFIYSVKNGYRFQVSFFLFSLCLLFIAYFTCKNILFSIFFPGKSVEGISSMSGRLILWSGYIQIWLFRPIQGWGFAVGERAGQAFDFIYALSAHNGILSILINTGLIGLTYWLVLFKRLIFSIVQQFIFHSPYATPIASALVVILVNNNCIPIFGSIWGILSTNMFCILSFWSLWCEYAPISQKQNQLQYNVYAP